MESPITRRQFLVASTLAAPALLARAAPADPGPAAVGPGEDVEISVADQVVHEMKSGVGASWHSLIDPTVSHGGSGFGGTPPDVPMHEGLWRSLERRAEWLGLKFIRAEMDWRQWQPEKGRFTWDSPGMRILERILAWAQGHGSDVLLQCMWANVPWLAYPEYRQDPALVQVSAPCDLGALAEGWVVLLRELIGRRGHTCIRWIHIVNEPNYYWWLVPPDTAANQDRARQARRLADALAAVRAAVRAAGLPVGVMGPGWTDLPVIARLSDEAWWPHVDEVDFHCYGSCFDWEDPAGLPAPWAFRMGERLSATLPDYRRETAALGRGLFLTEFGSQVYGWRGDDPQPGSFKASLKDTELLVRSLNLGIDGANHWSFTNRGDQDGQWQYVDTWDRSWKQWTAEAAPHWASYYVLGLATRHIPHRARVLAAEVRGGAAGGCPRVWAAALRSPADRSLTVLLVNDADRPWPLRLSVPGGAGALHSICSAAPAQARPELHYEPVAAAGGAGRLTLEPFSLTVVTDKPLAPDGPGRW